MLYLLLWQCLWLWCRQLCWEDCLDLWLDLLWLLLLLLWKSKERG